MLRHNCAYFALPSTTSILYLPYTYPYLMLLREVLKKYFRWLPLTLFWHFCIFAPSFLGTKPRANHEVVAKQVSDGK